jgi:hypothetical protein
MRVRSRQEPFIKKLFDKTQQIFIIVGAIVPLKIPMLTYVSPMVLLCGEKTVASVRVFKFEDPLPQRDNRNIGQHRGESWGESLSVGHTAASNSISPVIGFQPFLEVILTRKFPFFELVDAISLGNGYPHVIYNEAFSLRNFYKSSLVFGTDYFS